MTTKTFNSNTDNHDEWLTPPYIIESLGEFDLDPCAPHPDKAPWKTAKKSYWREVSGLSQKWEGRVWCNPPYGKQTFNWIRKLAEHGNGIGLIFARTETKGFHSEVLEKADGIFFFKGRLKFYKITGEQAKHTANAPACLIVYGENNMEAVLESGLKGKLVYLK